VYLGVFYDFGLIDGIEESTERKEENQNSEERIEGFYEGEKYIKNKETSIYDKY